MFSKRNLLGKKADKGLFIICTLLLCFSNNILAITAEDFWQDPNIRDVEISPNGRYLATVVNQGQTRSVIVQDLSQPKTPIVGRFTQSLVRPASVSWVNNEKLLVNLLVPYDLKYVKHHAKRKDFDISEYYMSSRTVVADVSFKNIVPLMKGEHRLRRNANLSRVRNYLPDDPDHILMPAWKSGKQRLYKVNINTGEASIVVTGSRKTVRIIADNKGNPLYRIDYHPFLKAFKIYKYLGAEKWEKIDQFYVDEDKDKEGSVDTEGLIGLYENSLLYRKRNENTGFYDLISQDRKTGEIKTLVSLKDRDVFRLLVRNDVVIGYTTEEDYSTSHFFNSDTQSRYDKIAKKVGKNYFWVSTRNLNSDKTVIWSSSPDNPGSYHLYDHKTDELMFLQNTHFGLGIEKLGIAASATIKARDGLSIRNYILFPPGYKKETAYPMVIMPHGGPYARSRASYNEFAQFIATRGYIVIQPNFRGSTGYGQEFEEAGYKKLGTGMLNDMEDSVKFMINKGYADPKRICIVGFSYGGYAALMSAVKTPDLYQCSVSVNGVTDLKAIIKHSKRNIKEEDDRERLLYKRIGHPKEDSELLIAQSPLMQVEKIKTPILLIAGTNDSIVPYSQSMKMREALKKHGKKYKFIELVDAYHYPFYYRDDFLEVYDAVEEFLADHL